MKEKQKDKPDFLKQIYETFS